MVKTNSSSGIDTFTPAPGHVSTDHGAELGSDSRFLVIVVATTIEGTIASLRTAAALAADLGARIDLLMTTPIPIRFPLETPPVAVSVLLQRMNTLVEASGLSGDEVMLRLWLCRDPNATLAAVLPPRSIVVVGGRGRSWCWRERTLRRFLARLGHQVVSAEVRRNDHFQAWWRGLFSSAPSLASSASHPRREKSK